MKKLIFALLILGLPPIEQAKAVENNDRYKKYLYSCASEGKPDRTDYLWYRYPTKDHKKRDKKDNGQVDLIWEDIGGAHSVAIKYWHKGKHAKTVITDDNGGETIKKLKNGKKYHFKVRGISNCGKGKWSKELVVYP